MCSPDVSEGTEVPPCRQSPPGFQKHHHAQHEATSSRHEGFSPERSDGEKNEVEVEEEEERKACRRPSLDEP